jgi:hypothetical protein
MKQIGWIKAAAIVAAAGIITVIGCAQQPMQSSAALPRYQVDPLWMKAMPENWIFGQVSSAASSAHAAPGRKGPRSKSADQSLLPIGAAGDRVRP